MFVNGINFDKNLRKENQKYSKYHPRVHCLPILRRKRDWELLDCPSSSRWRPQKPIQNANIITLSQYCMNETFSKTFFFWTTTFTTFVFTYLHTFIYVSIDMFRDHFDRYSIVYDSEENCKMLQHILPTFVCRNMLQ